jgi:hypothetical protein
LGKQHLKKGWIAEITELQLIQAEILTKKDIAWGYQGASQESFHQDRRVSA